MPEDLEDKLVKIEKKLGGSGDVPQVRDLEWHLDTIESLIGGGGPGGTSDHTQLTNRDAADQHPISSITNLQSTLDSKAASTDLDGKQNAIPIFPVTNFGYDHNNFSFDVTSDVLTKLKANTEKIIILNDITYEQSYTHCYIFTLAGINNDDTKTYYCNTTDDSGESKQILLEFYTSSYTSNRISGVVHRQVITSVNIDDFSLSADGYLSLPSNSINEDVSWDQYPISDITPEQLATLKALLPTRNIESIKTLDFVGMGSSSVKINSFIAPLTDQSNGWKTAFPIKVSMSDNTPVLIWTDDEYYYIITYWTVNNEQNPYLFRATFNYATGGGKHLKARVAASDVTITPLTENGITQNIQVTFNSADFINILAEDLFRIRFAVNDSIMGKDPEWKFADYYINSKLANETILGSTATSMLIANDSWDDVGSTIVVYKSDSNVTITFLQSVWVSIINQIKDLIADDNFYIEIETLSGSSGSSGDSSLKLYSHTFTYQLADLNFTVNLVNAYSQSYGTGFQNIMSSYLANMLNYPNFVKDWIWDTGTTTFRRPIVDLSTNMSSQITFYIVDYSTGTISPININFTDILNIDTMSDTVTEYGSLAAGTTSSYPKIKEISLNNYLTDEQVLQFFQVYSQGSGCAFLTASSDFMTAAEFDEYDMIKARAYINGNLAFEGWLQKQASVPVKAYGLSFGEVASEISGNCQIYLYIGSSSGSSAINKIGINATHLN